MHAAPCLARNDRRLLQDALKRLHEMSPQARGLQSGHARRLKSGYCCSGLGTAGVAGGQGFGWFAWFMAVVVASCAPASTLPPDCFAILASALAACIARVRCACCLSLSR